LANWQLGCCKDDRDLPLLIRIEVYRLAYPYDENTVVYFDKYGSKHVRKGGSVSWRINNPGLVKSHSHYSVGNGSIGSCQRFAIFSYPEQGHKALFAWLHSKKYYNASIQAIAEHYHPNKTDAFILKLCDYISVSKDKKLKSFTDLEFQKLLKAIEKSCGYGLIGNEEICVAVGKKKPGQCIWGFINGILNSREGALESAELIATHTGGEQILSLPNDSQLLGAKDAGVCFSLKLGIDTPIVSWAAKFFRYMLALSSKEEANPPVIVFAHSQGAIISEHALKLLNDDERNKLRIFTFGGGSFLDVGSCHPDSHNFASRNDLISSVGSPYFRSLAVHRYLLMKEGLTQEAIIQRWALDDTLLYLDDVDDHVFESFIKRRVEHYEILMEKISNVTILDPDPSCYFEHQFCNVCYQDEVKRLVKKFQDSWLTTFIQEKELLYV
jgi:hypothetical protein